MKTLINLISLSVVLGLTISNSAFAQTPMVKGTQVIQLGVGLGGNANISVSETPYIVGSYEIGIIENLGPGNLSIGGMVGFKSGNDNSLAVDWSYNYFALAARSSWHPHFINSDKLDVYTGLSLGFETISTNFEGAIGDAYDFSTSDLFVAGHIGARYNFSESWGAWAELGYGLGTLTVGASYNF